MCVCVCVCVCGCERVCAHLSFEEKNEKNSFLDGEHQSKKGMQGKHGDSVLLRLNISKKKFQTFYFDFENSGLRVISK